VRLSDLQTKKIISMSNGKNIGSIIDVIINQDGKIESLILESSKSIFNLNKEIDGKIYWNEIEKIGEDVILVKKDY